MRFVPLITRYDRPNPPPPPPVSLVLSFLLRRRLRSADWQDGARGRAGNAGNENRRCRKEQMVPAAMAALVTSACLGNGFVDSTFHGGSVRTCGALSPKCCLVAANQGAQ